MRQPFFVMEFNVAAVELLARAGVSRELMSDASGRDGAPHSVLMTSDFAELNRWRLFLNREARPYRYRQHDTNGVREMGRSRSPDWL